MLKKSTNVSRSCHSDGTAAKRTADIRKAPALPPTSKPTAPCLCCCCCCATIAAFRIGSVSSEIDE